MRKHEGDTYRKYRLMQCAPLAAILRTLPRTVRTIQLVSTNEFTITIRDAEVSRLSHDQAVNIFGAGGWGFTLCDPDGTNRWLHWEEEEDNEEGEKRVRLEKMSDNDELCIADER